MNKMEELLERLIEDLESLKEYEAEELKIISLRIFDSLNDPDQVRNWIGTWFNQADYYRKEIKALEAKIEWTRRISERYDGSGL